MELFIEARLFPGEVGGDVRTLSVKTSSMLLGSDSGVFGENGLPCVEVVDFGEKRVGEVGTSTPFPGDKAVASC